MQPFPFLLARKSCSSGHIAEEASRVAMQQIIPDKSKQVLCL
jgi:hypothetical protein